MSQSRLANVAGRIRLYADWPKVVFPINRIFRMFGLNPKVHVRGGPALTVRLVSDDLSMINEVLGHDSYGLGTLMLNESPVVVDVGGNIGTFSAAVRQHFPNARVTAYEPHPANFALLQINCPWAHIEQKAIAGTAGQVHIEDSRNTSALRLASSGIAVPAITLEEALSPFTSVDLLKVDIEGSEFDVFTHTPARVMDKVRHIMVEVHNPQWRSWFEQFFNECGFKARWDRDLIIAKK